MKADIYTVSAPVFMLRLKNLAHLLEKAAAHAAERGFEADKFLDCKLAPDMWPLLKQVQVTCDFAKNTAARLAGQEPAKVDDVETTLPQLQDRIARTIALVEAVPAAAFEGAEARTITLQTPRGEMKFDGLTYLNGFGLPNFYFHLSTCYAILRAAGVPLGKMDLLQPR